MVVVGHVDVADLLGVTRYVASGKKFVLGNILVWLIEVAQTRAYSRTAGYSGQGDQEFYMHSFLLGDHRNLDSAQTEGLDLGRKLVAEGFVGIRTVNLESMTLARRAMKQAGGIVVVWLELGARGR